MGMHRMLPFFAAAILCTTSCAHNTRPQNASLLKPTPEATAARLGRWGAADTTLTTEALAYSAGQCAWVKSWTTSHGLRPSIRVVPLKNLCDEDIDVDKFSAALKQALINTGKFEVGQSDAASADLMCATTLSRRTETVEGALASLYEMSLQLVPKTGEQPVWQRVQLLHKWQAPPPAADQGEAGSHAAVGSSAKR